MVELQSERARRRRAEAARPDPAEISRQGADGRVLALQHAAGNRAVAALLARVPLRVTDVDYDPRTAHRIHADVHAHNLGIRIRASTFNPVLSGAERQRIDQLGAQNLQAADVPSLATAVIAFLANGAAVRVAALTAARAGLEQAIAEVAETGANEREKVAFRGVQGMAQSMSRSKGTANVVPLANVQGPLAGAIAGVAQQIRTRNNALFWVQAYASKDAETGISGRASVGMDGVRSAHQNVAGWLPPHVAPDHEPALDAAAQAWLAATAATGTVAEQAEINLHFPAPGRATATSQAVEASALSTPLRRKYFTTAFAAALPTRQARLELAWSRYAEDFLRGCPYIEFTASEAGGVSRFIWDYVNHTIYANTHYNWVDGFNPFFEITGAPAT